MTDRVRPYSQTLLTTAEQNTPYNPQGRGGAMRGFQQHQRGGGGGSSRGGRHGGPQGPQPTLDKPKREAILDLAKYVDARIRVKFTGGREGVCNFFFPGHNTQSTKRATTKKKN
jgi:hypothetical protein